MRVLAARLAQNFTYRRFRRGKGEFAENSSSKGKLVFSRHVSFPSVVEPQRRKTTSNQPGVTFVSRSGTDGLSLSLAHASYTEAMASVSARTLMERIRHLTTHCPYCTSHEQFKSMRVLENGRQICESCGHIVFPGDTAFRCPCQKCLAIQFSTGFHALIR